MIADITYRGPDGVGQICLEADGAALAIMKWSFATTDKKGEAEG